MHILNSEHVHAIYPVGGEHVVLRWKHYYYLHHLLIARTVEDLDRIACAVLPRKGCRPLVFEPALAVEIVAPPVWYRDFHKQEVREFEKRLYAYEVRSQADYIRDRTGALPPGFAACDCEEGCDACAHSYSRIRVPELDFERVYDEDRAKEPDPEPAWRMRTAGEDEEIYYAQGGGEVRLYRLTRGAWLGTEEPGFFYVNPRPVTLPGLEALQAEEAAQTAREEVEAEVRQAERAKERSAEDVQELEEALSFINRFRKKE